MALLLCEGDGLVALIALELDFADIDVAHEVATLEHEKAALDSCGIADFYLLPLGGEGDVGVFAIAPVAQLAVKIACL